MLNPAQHEWLKKLGVVAAGSELDAGADAMASASAGTASLLLPMAADCKIVRGKIPGPAHHVLCQTHNHVLDVKARVVIAASVQDYSRRFPKPSDETVAQAVQAAAAPPTQPAPTPQQMVAIASADVQAAAVERKRLIARITCAKIKVESALARYVDQKKISDDQWIISGLARAAKEVTTLGDFEDPGPALTEILAQVRVSARSAIDALTINDILRADGICTQIDDLATKAQKLAHCYSEDLIDGAETAKTTVKVVDAGAKVVGGVALTVATGGAAAGVVAAEVGTAAAISVAGGVAASTAGVATKLALGDKVDWGAFSIDILMQGLLTRFGGKLTEGIAGAVAQRLGPLAATVGGAVIKNVAAQAVMHVNTTMFKTALETAYQKLNGHDLTLQQVYDSCIEQLTDPSSLVVAAATSAAQGHLDAKLAAASRSPASSALAPPASPSSATVPPTERVNGAARTPEHAEAAKPGAVGEGAVNAKGTVVAEGTGAAKGDTAVEGMASAPCLPNGLLMPQRNSAAAKLKFVTEHADLLSKGRRAQFDALDGKMPAQNQLAAWEKQIEKALRDRQSRAVERGLGLPEGSVSTQKRPRGGPRGGGFEHEKTMAGISGERPSDVTHTLRTRDDQAQFDSLGPPGGKPQPKEYKSHDTPPDEFQRQRRSPQDAYEAMQRANAEAADAAHARLATEEDLDFQAKQFADQMERQARIVTELKLPPVKWPMHSQRVQDYFETKVLPLVPRELRSRIHLIAEHYFD